MTTFESEITMIGFLLFTFLNLSVGLPLLAIIIKRAILPALTTEQRP